MSTTSIKQKDHFKIFSNWLASASGARSFSKVFVVANKWLKHFQVPRSEAWDKTVNIAGDVKGALSFTCIPKHLSGTIKNTAGFFKSWEVHTGLNAMGDATSLVGYGSEAATYLHAKEVFSLSDRVLNLIKKIGGPALLLGASWGSYKNCEKVVEEIDPEQKVGLFKNYPKVNLYAMRLAVSVSSVALAILSILSAFFAVEVAPVVLILLATNALVFSITSYFYDKIVEPEK